MPVAPSGSTSTAAALDLAGTADSFGAGVARGAFTAAGIPVDVFRTLIDNLPELTITKHKEKRTQMPSIKSTLLKIKNWFVNYHKKIFNHATRQSKTVEDQIESFFMKVLTPISCFKTGKVVQEAISKRMGYLARIISFGAIQFLHALPYLTASALVTGGVLLYQVAPVALAIVIGSSLFFVQVLLTYMIVRGVDATQATLDEKTEELKKLAMLAMSTEGIFRDELLDKVKEKAQEIADAKYTQAAADADRSVQALKAEFLREIHSIVDGARSTYWGGKILGPKPATPPPPADAEEAEVDAAEGEDAGAAAPTAAAAEPTATPPQPKGWKATAAAWVPGLGGRVATSSRGSASPTASPTHP